MSEVRLIISVRSDDPAVKEPDGLLTERRFEAGPVLVVVGSVIGHTCDGWCILSHVTPSVSVRSHGWNWTNPSREIAATTEEFAGTLAVAIENAQKHAAAVTAWIDERIIEAAKERLGIEV